MPEDRIELSTPGLLDQCSSHWATRACFLYVLFSASISIVFQTILKRHSHMPFCSSCILIYTMEIIIRNVTKQFHNIDCARWGENILCFSFFRLRQLQWWYNAGEAALNSILKEPISYQNRQCMSKYIRTIADAINSILSGHHLASEWLWHAWPGMKSLDMIRALDSVCSIILFRD